MPTPRPSARSTRRSGSPSRAGARECPHRATATSSPPCPTTERSSPMRIRMIRAAALIGVLAAAGQADDAAAAHRDGLSSIGHIVVVYEENHSFDNLYVRWPGVRGLHD